MNGKARYFLSLLALGMGGSTIWLLMYIRYVFYDPMIETLGCTNAQLGALTTITTVAGWAFTIPNGICADKFNNKWLIVLALTLNAGAAFFFAINTTYTGAIITWCLLAFSVGLGYWPSLIKFINGLAGPEKSGQSFSIYYGIYGVFAACVNVVEVKIGNMVGFRGTVLVIGCTALVCALLDVFLLPNEGKKEKAAAAAAAEAGEKIEEKHKLSLSDFVVMVKWPGFWLIGFLYLFTYTIYAQVSYYNPWLINVIGLSSEASSVFSIVRTYLFMLWCPLGGILADKVFKSSYKTYVVLFAISFVLLAGTLVMKPGINPTVAAVYSCVPSIFLMPLYSITYSCMRELHFNPAVTGLTVSVSGLLGGLVDGAWPVMFGSWLDKFGNAGYNYIFLFLAADCLVGIVWAILIGNHHKKCLAGKRVQLMKGETTTEVCPY